MNCPRCRAKGMKYYSKESFMYVFCKCGHSIELGVKKESFPNTIGSFRGQHKISKIHAGYDIKRSKERKHTRGNRERTQAQNNALMNDPNLTFYMIEGVYVNRSVWNSWGGEGDAETTPPTLGKEKNVS